METTIIASNNNLSDSKIEAPDQGVRESSNSASPMSISVASSTSSADPSPVMGSTSIKSSNLVERSIQANGSTRVNPLSTIKSLAVSVENGLLDID